MHELDPKTGCQNAEITTGRPKSWARTERDRREPRPLNTELRARRPSSRDGQKEGAP